MIEEQYVDFDTARLLKVKGFRAKCNRYYNAQYDMIRTVSDTFMMDFNDEEHMKSIGMEGAVNIPTQQMAMRWLREKHSLYLKLEPYVYNHEVMYDFCIERQVYNHPNLFDGELLVEYVEKDGEYYYEEACEAAIKYCLENLI